jgi:hypothetical protein
METKNLINEEFICIRCQNEIKPKEHFIEIIEWDNQKLLKKNRVHYSCWELFMDTKTTQHQALGMLKSVMNKLNYVNG